MEIVAIVVGFGVVFLVAGLLIFQPIEMQLASGVVGLMIGGVVATQA